MNFSGTIWDYFGVYVAGVLVSFTPCVYPVMPITAGFIAGINTQGTKLRGFFLSVIYVFGLALTYSALAVVASLTGKVFGQIQNNPIFFLITANLLIFFALAMFDVIPLPALGFSFQHKIKGKTFIAVLLMGIASGLVIGPCTAPALAGILIYVAAKQNLWHSISLLFVFSYGVGTSLILVGTFSGLLANLPKSGKWMMWIKRLAGLLLLGVAEYFLIRAGSLFTTLF